MSSMTLSVCPCCGQVLAFVANEHYPVADRLPSRTIVECVNVECLLYGTSSTHANLVTAYNALIQQEGEADDGSH